MFPGAVVSRDMVMKGMDKGYFANCCCDDSSAFGFDLGL